MAVFAYNPDTIKTWGNSVLNYLNGGSESVEICSKKFSEQIEKLVQPNVWTGAAAYANYQQFMTAHKTLNNFANLFGSAFESAMNTVNANVARLEQANLGGNTNVGSFSNLDFNTLTSLSEQNIKSDVVTYDTATILSIGSELKSIVGMLENVNNGLKAKLEEINNQSGMWDGNAAESAKTELLNVLSSNMTKIFEILNVCVSNISTAAEQAQTADRA